MLLKEFATGTQPLFVSPTGALIPGIVGINVRGDLFQILAFGSTVAAFAQGVALGALVQGIKVDGRAYAGGWWDWLTPYTLLTGLGTVAGYALLGSTWLVWKLEGAAQDHARRMAVRAAWATIALMGAVSLYNITLNADYAERWLSAPEIAKTLQ